MGALYFLYYKLPRPLFILMALLFLFTMIVGLGRTNNNRPNHQEKHHVHADRRPR